MLGVPVGDHASIRRWSADIARSLDAIGQPSDQSIVERGRLSRRALADYFRALLPERRANPQPDLLSGLLAAEEQGDKLTEPEVIAMCLLLFIAGHETTVNLIGNGLLALLLHPDQLARVQGDPTLIPNAIEELLRYDSPVQRTARIAHTDIDLAGHQVAKGTMVVTALGAANRDPAQFAEPDRLDVTRRDIRHISFGYGIHFCLGAPLARVEGQIALGTLLRLAPGLTLAEPSPEWRESSVLRGLKRLRVTF
jgi:cytochrome P450